MLQFLDFCYVGKSQIFACVSFGGGGTFVCFAFILIPNSVHQMF